MINIGRGGWPNKALFLFSAFYLGLGFGSGIASLNADFGFNLAPFNLAQVGSTTSSTTPSIKVTSPQGGETFAIGETIKISWQATGLDQMRLTIWQNSSFKGDIATVPNTGSYSWTIPDRLLPGTGYRIRVRDPISGAPATTFADSANFTLATSTPKVISTPSAPAPAAEPILTVTPLTPNVAKGKIGRAKVVGGGIEYCPTQGSGASTCCFGQGGNGGTCPGFRVGITPFPAYALDGVSTSSSNLWCSANQVNALNLNDWYMVDLGTTHQIDQVQLAFATGHQTGGPYACTRATDYIIQTSNDNVNWTTQKTVTGNTNDVISHAFTNQPIARYVRIYTTKLSSSGWRLGLREFEIKGTDARELDQGVFIDSLSLNQINYGSTQTITINGGGFTATGSRIMLDNVQIQAPFSSTNNGTKITFQAPTWAWPKTYQLEVFNSNGISNAVNFIVNPPTGSGYLLIRSSTGKTAYATIASVNTNKSTWFTRLKDFVSSSVAAVLGVEKTSGPELNSASKEITIDDGESVSFEWKFPDGAYSRCFRYRGTTQVPLKANPSQTVSVGDPNFQSDVVGFGQAERFSSLDPQGEVHYTYGPFQHTQGLQNYNQGSYATGPLKRPPEAVTDQAVSIPFQISCGKVDPNDPEKTVIAYGEGSWNSAPPPFPVYDQFNVTVTINPTPVYHCEQPFSQISDELRRPFSEVVSITEDSFSDWASDESSKLPITDDNYDASGGTSDIIRDLLLPIQSCQRTGLIPSGNRVEDDVAHFEALTRDISKGRAGYLNVWAYNILGAPRNSDRWGHALLPVHIDRSAELLPPLNLPVSYSVSLIDPNSPNGTVSLNFVLKNVTLDSGVNEWLYASELYGQSIRLGEYFSVPYALPPDTEFCRRPHGSEYDDFCERNNVVDWLQGDRFPIRNPNINGGLCGGWVRTVLEVGYRGAFIGECLEPKI